MIMWTVKWPAKGSTRVLEHTLRMHIYDILFEHTAKSTTCPRNSLVRSLSLWQDLQREEAKYEIYHIHNDDSGSFFSLIQLFS